MADILLVDDDGSVLLTLAIALRRLGHAVTVACDAEQALRRLNEHCYTFLLSDVRMPGMSGIELAARAASLREHPRVILTSAYSDIAFRPDEVEAFFLKPLDIDRLNALLVSDKPLPNQGRRPHAPAKSIKIPPPALAA